MLMNVLQCIHFPRQGFKSSDVDRSLNKDA